MISSSRNRCAFILVGLRFLLLDAVDGFHVTTVTKTTMSNAVRCNQCIYTAKGDEDEVDFEEDKDDSLWSSRGGGGLQFDPLGAYPLSDRMIIKKPNKLDLYSADELWNVLNIHQQLGIKDENISNNNNSKKNDNGNDLSKGITPDLHEMVLQALQQMEETTDDSDQPSSAVLTPSSSPGGPINLLTDKVRSKLRKIRAIASDVDGTLVAAKYSVHPTTQAAVLEAVHAAYGNNFKNKDDDDDETSSSSSSSKATTTNMKEDLQLFFLATGKSRAGAMESLGPVIKRVLTQDYSVPGVYIQGLYCVDDQGSVIFEKRLTKQAVQAATLFALDHYSSSDSSDSLSMFGYNGDVILTTKEANAQHVLDYHNVWGEPVPIVIDSFVDYAPGFHKILFMSNNHQRLKQQLRPRLDSLAVENNCATTQAVPNMIELLPAGCSKALGVEKLCQHYGIDPSTQLLAIGDAENDIGMLEMCSVGVAVGNASPLVKDVADIVIPESHIQGGAGIAIQQFGLRKALHQ